MNLDQYKTGVLYKTLNNIYLNHADQIHKIDDLVKQGHLS